MTSERLHFVLFINGVFLMAMAATMLIPGAVDLVSGRIRDAINFGTCTVVVGIVGSSLAAGFHRPDFRLPDRRTGYLVTVTAWLSASLFGALPLYFSSLKITYIDAVFETVSGLTTTGATVLSGLDTMPDGLLLWRSLLNWIGGVGIIVMALSILPALAVGGMQLFHSESSDISEKPFPKVRQLTRMIAIVYVSLTIACIACLVMAGMPVFDAVNNAMATIATGGFSVKDASIGFYNSVPIEIILEIFMMAGGLPLAFYAVILVQRGRTRVFDQQIKPFMLTTAAAIALATLWNISQGMEPPEALRGSAFNVISVITSTGFVTSDFSSWGSFAVGLFFMLYFVGGCAGSTAGGIKVFRWQLLFSGMSASLRRMLSPNAIIATRYQGKPVEESEISAVRNFFFLYLITFAAIAVALTATGLDFLTAFSASAQAMGNIGPGLGPIVGPATNYESISQTAKVLISLGMLLGRLELATFYVVLLPTFWTR
ncbi:TrkH family potassium uptake protein [Pararhizobium mangrovi]|uniref:Trk system potassium uptake protein n=1 Tax=Pararhizobium mangrovi TaxID=2590452 RepID=A0A506TZ37_9HYPH|nr:TrkH family potassium uptake protein [Pararhizobium mangrovi]TPW26468.1 TrkH family potassium uptake protein [Pararhizobium mangrovi]